MNGQVKIPASLAQVETLGREISDFLVDKFPKPNLEEQLRMIAALNMVSDAMACTTHQQVFDITLKAEAAKSTFAGV